MLIYIQGVSEICGQTLRAYPTCCKDEKSHINVGPERLPLQVISLILQKLLEIISSASIHASHWRRIDCRRRSKIPGVFRIFSHAVIIRFQGTSTVATGVSYTIVLECPHK